MVSASRLESELHLNAAFKHDGCISVQQRRFFQKQAAFLGSTSLADSAL
jgi:hypothetical protein